MPSVIHVHPRRESAQQASIGEAHETWKIVKLGDLATQLRSGITPKGGEKVYLKHGVPLIRSQNVLMNRLSMENVAYISPEVHKAMSGSAVQPGDVLLNITGASIGRVAVVPTEVKVANVNQHVCRIRFGEGTDPAFICLFLSTARGQSQIMGSQFGTTRQGLNYGNVRAIKVPLPSIEEQRTITSALLAIQKAREVRHKELELLDELWDAALDGVMSSRFSVLSRLDEYEAK